jgi:6-phosphogluconolactonase (cycloisomerase 2 family)
MLSTTALLPCLKQRSFKRYCSTALSIAFCAIGSLGMLQARTGRANLLYIINNDPTTGNNAVLGYTRAADGSLTEIAGSPFYTGGTGYRNVNERIGPDDSDGEMVISPDHRFLFVTNTGSNDISVFQIRLDGTLRLVTGSPFNSGGIAPVSLTLANGFLYVVNRGDGILPTQVAPTYVQGTRGMTNYSVMSVGFDGTLSLLPQMKIDAPDGSSPSQVVVTPDGQFMFGDTFLAPSQNPPFAGIFPFSHSLLTSFALDEDDGSTEVQPSVGIPNAAPFVVSGAFRPFLLGMRPHPTQNILYVEAVTAGALVVFNWDQSGVLTYHGAVGANGAGGQCWTAIDPAAKFLYTSAIGPDVISVFSLADPLNPVFVQNFALGGPKGTLPTGTPEPETYTTAPFNLSVDPSGQHLYVVNHTTCTSTSIDATNCPAGNAIHIMNINADGTLTETSASPLIFPATEVPNDTHPKGIIVL